MKEKALVQSRAFWTALEKADVDGIHHAKSGGGQMLICVAGRGWYQEWGKEAQELRPGDVVNIPEGVKHWHGAAADSWFQHLAIEVPGEESKTEWCEAVDNEVYTKLP